MSISFFDNPVITLTANGNEWWNIIITLIPIAISVFALGITIITYFKTIPKMKKAEQIKMVHDIQIMYLSAFEKYAKVIKEKDEYQFQFICYTSLLDALEWYIFLKNDNQLSDVFDQHFKTYFKAVYDIYYKYKDSIMERDYKGVKNQWRKMDLNIDNI